MPEPDNLAIDESRRGRYQTPIFVRARTALGDWESTDISNLTGTSLLIWLHSRGDCNPWAENVVGLLLGHGHIHA